MRQIRNGTITVITAIAAPTAIPIIAPWDKPLYMEMAWESEGVD